MKGGGIEDHGAHSRAGSPFPQSGPNSNYGYVGAGAAIPKAPMLYRAPGGGGSRTVP